MIAVPCSQRRRRLISSSYMVMMLHDSVLQYGSNAMLRLWGCLTWQPLCTFLCMLVNMAVRGVKPWIRKAGSHRLIGLHGCKHLTA